MLGPRSKFRTEESPDGIRDFRTPAFTSGRSIRADFQNTSRQRHLRPRSFAADVSPLCAPSVYSSRRESFLPRAPGLGPDVVEDPRRSSRDSWAGIRAAQRRKPRRELGRISPVDRRRSSRRTEDLFFVDLQCFMVSVSLLQQIIAN